jgi:hypothetical protein
MTHQLRLRDLPYNVFTLIEEDFFDLVKTHCGDLVAKLLRIQAISSAEILLTIENVFAIFEHDAAVLDELRPNMGVTNRDGKFVVKPGILLRFDAFRRSLSSRLPANQPSSLTSDDLTIPADLLQRFPSIRTLIDLLQASPSSSTDSNFPFLSVFLKNLLQNIDRSNSRYRFDDLINQFAFALFVIAGRNAYEFIRINLPACVPSITSLRTYMKSSKRQMVEGQFYYDDICQHLNEQNSNFVYVAEDSTAGS